MFFINFKFIIINQGSNFLKKLKKGKKIGIANSIETCLGFNNIDRKGTRVDFASIKDKINSKLVGWKTRVLFQAGKTILIKANLTGSPIFTMQGLKF